MIRVEVAEDADGVAVRGAAEVAARARGAVADHGRFAFAVSGGRTPWAMFRRLVGEDVPWDQMAIFQVDERIAPAGDPGRTLTQLLEVLPRVVGELRPMPVDDADLETAAAGYAAALPARFDLIHLGLGADGHTASLVPGDPVLGVRDRDVALTGTYRGHRRMTMTYRVLERAASILWLVTGEDKAEALAGLIAADPALPAANVGAADQLLICDRAAAAGLAPGGS